MELFLAECVSNQSAFWETGSYIKYYLLLWTELASCFVLKPNPQDMLTSFKMIILRPLMLEQMAKYAAIGCSDQHKIIK